MNPVLVVSGVSLAKDLLDANTLLGRSYNNVDTQAVVEDLLGLAEQTWALENIDAGLGNVTARFDGVSAWNALLKIAQIHNRHIRVLHPDRKLELGAFGGDSGVWLFNPEALGRGDWDNPDVGLVDAIRVEEEGENVINRIIPVGAGEGNNLFDLRWSTRSSPYAIQSLVGPDGEDIFFLEDAASVAAHGRVTRVLTFKDVVPVANSPAAFENAANALYDLAVHAMERFKGTPTYYDVSVAKMPNVRVGDVVHLVYRGLAEDQNGRRLWLDVDEDLIVLEVQRQFDERGIETKALQLATIGRFRLDDTEVLIGALETLHAFKTAIKFYTYSISHGTERESIQASGSRWFDYPVRFDNNINRLLAATLTAKVRALKANTTGAASGGGQTSSSETSHTHGVSGQSATSGGSQSPTTSTSLGSILAVSGWTHKHRWAIFLDTSTSGGWGRWREGDPDQGAAFDLPAYGATTLRTSVPADPSDIQLVTASDHTHTVTISAHGHTVTGTTSGGGSSHAHTVSDHAHALIYGVFVGSLPSTPGVQVWINGTNRTTALGGPWNNDFEADITPYLVDAAGQPLRQENIVQIRKASSTPDAIDVIVQVNSLVIASALGVA